MLEIEGRTALLWVGYDLGLVTGLLGRPGAVHMAGAGCLGGRGSAADVVLGYPDAIARCASSSLMPRPYGVRGGWRATFTGVVLEYAMRAGFTGEGLAALTEYTAEGENLIGLPAASRPCAVVIDQVLACLAAANLIEPASALAALELTLEVHQRLTRLGPVPRGSRGPARHAKPEAYWDLRRLRPRGPRPLTLCRRAVQSACTASPHSGQRNGLRLARDRM